MATVKLVEPGNNSLSINHIITVDVHGDMHFYHWDF